MYEWYSENESLYFLLQIIHRDLAARNVLVGEGEKCKVTDFGMSRNVHQDEIYTRKSRVRMISVFFLSSAYVNPNSCFFLFHLLM